MLCHQLLRTLKLSCHHRPCAQAVRRLHWHGNAGDQEEKIKKTEHQIITKFEDDASLTLAQDQERIYAPARIFAEENAMRNGYGGPDGTRMVLVDWCGLLRHDYRCRFTNPRFYWCMRVKEDYEMLVKSQKFIKERIATLGPDLAAAHFLISRHCRVRFKGHTNWIKADNFQFFTGKTLDLPLCHAPDWHLEAIGMSNCCSSSVQALFKHCLSSVQALFKLCASSMTITSHTIYFSDASDSHHGDGVADGHLRGRHHRQVGDVDEQVADCDLSGDFKWAVRQD